MKHLFILFLIIAVSCGPKCPNSPEPLFQKGEVVKLKAMNYNRETVITDRQLNPETCTYDYAVTYYTIWGTKRNKIVPEVEIEKIK